MGNTSAASIPLALTDAVAHGRLVAGQRVLMTSFGGGLSWGSTALVWPPIQVSDVLAGPPDLPPVPTRKAPHHDR